MTSHTVVERLSAARRRQFVGRTGECDLFRHALSASELPFQVLHIFGPGGVGKTSLLRQFAQIAEEFDVYATLIDARNIDASPDSFATALRTTLNLDEHASPINVLAQHSKPLVILIDTYEALTPLDGWLREIFLPQVSANVMLVLAGREMPSMVWRSDVGWQALMQMISLRNLDPDESRAYLHQRGVPVDQHQAVLDFTHGHPLALSLVADVFAQRGAFAFQPEATPDIVKTLLEQFVQKVPGPAHRAALEACAMARLLSESLLGAMLGIPDMHELFQWLRELSFIDADRYGLFPHDLAREALVADVRWRNPDWYAELHRRARDYYKTHILQSSDQEQRRFLLDLIYLHRDNPAVRPFFEWQEGGNLFTDSMNDDDVPELLALIEQHEGVESARIAAHWFNRQPRNVVVLRDVQRHVQALLVPVALHETEPEDLEIDLALRAAWRYLLKHVPLRSGERATYFRFWMARETYQAVSPAQSRIFISAVQHYLITQGLAYTFFSCADPDFWMPVLSYADLARIPELDFEVEGRRYAIFGHDWRVVPPAAWLELLAQREIGARGVAYTPPQREAWIVLSESDFAQALQDALRNYLRSDVLAKNPLLRSRLIAEHAGADVDVPQRVEALQILLRETIDALHKGPRDTKLYRALYHTYLQPAPTQEQAAELLDLPFSTFRRHLKSGVKRVIDLLWSREIGQLEK